MRLLEDDLADAEQLHHHADAQAEADGEHRGAKRTGGQRSQRQPENHSTSLPLFIARRRDARAASAGLCVTTSIGGAAGVDAIEQRRDVLAGLVVQLAGRLVGDEQRRPVRQRARDRDTLHFAAGELRGQMIGPIGQTDVIQQLARPGAALAGGDTGFGLRQLDVLGGAEHRQQEEALEDESDACEPKAAALRFGELRRVAPIEEQRSARRRIDAADQMQQRRLAAAGRPGDRHVIAGVDGQ